MTYQRDIEFSPEQQEAFAELVNNRLRAFGWTRKEAAEHMGVGKDKVSVLTHTAPVGMQYGYFIKTMLGLDIDLYEVASLLGLDEDVKRLMEEMPEKYANARRNFAKAERDPLTALVKTLPADKQDKARDLIEAILRHI